MDTVCTGLSRSPEEKANILYIFPKKRYLKVLMGPKKSAEKYGK
ncbi:MAG: hypothetical protein QT03_C0001G0853 [archaeon GW2011_AR10]|nr:MAG: hypothetical protein QT03_C0001G0853 [archaeon GW2011_AR10]